jgi:hypothetical protein
MTKAVRLPLRTISEANSHEHWRKRQKRAKEQRGLAELLVSRELAPMRSWFAPGRVKLTRVSPRALDDDNLQSSQKHVRDGVADALGIDDRDPSIRWEYAQARGGKGEYAVIVELSDE